jgi:hypothetical protein
MFNSTVLEVAIGLTFCFGALSLVVSSINEAISTLMALRARTLRDGIKELVNDPGLAKSLYEHALINPLWVEGASNKVLPSYIEPRHFAEAFLECVQATAQNATGIEDAIKQIKDDQLRTLLVGMYQRAEKKVDALRDEVARWFDAGMDRLSGVYKRNAQLFSFGIALVLAIVLNVDTCRIFRTLWLHPAAVAQLTAPPQAAPAAIADLSALPVGWPNLPRGSQWPTVVFGWLLTASSALFGAPFWFDLLGRFVNLRGTGKKPAGDGDAR